MNIILHIAPRGRIADIQSQYINPFLSLIGWMIIVLYFWYIESSSITKVLYETDVYSNPSRAKMKKMSWKKRLFIIAKCLISDINNLKPYIKSNRNKSIAFIVIIIFIIASWFI